MQWTADGNAGFTSAGVDPWLPVNADHASVNVNAQLKKDAGLNSHAAIYSYLVRLEALYVPW
jgi:glycosidase